MSLKGRVAAVTGGAGHLGSVLCDALAELGAEVVVVDVSAERANAVVEDISARRNIRAAALTVDVTDEVALRLVPASIVRDFGRLDVLVNCAALVGTSALDGWLGPLEDQSSATFRKALEVNLTAPFVLTQAAAPALSEHANGSVINIGSIYGVVGPDASLYEGARLANPAAYAASKGGLVQLTRWLATALAPSIRVNAVSLGGISRGQAPAFVERYAKRTPLGRMATEHEVKGAVAYLAADASSYVTGHNLMVDGGWTAW
jgi:NAD(P)-dependent dehydrogenase (short-subunit alcohol dehydrogenase family)